VTPRSSCIIGRIGVNANLPMPMASASAARPDIATVHAVLFFRLRNGRFDLWGIAKV
jgi:hypothetical protein